ncbi:MAG: peptidase M30, partial [Spirochaetes bacterium]
MLPKRHFFYFLFIIVTVIYSLTSCSFFTVSYKNKAKIEVEHITATGDIHYEIDIKDEPVDIFFAFTNVNEMVGTDTPDVQSESIVVNGQEFPAPIPIDFEYSAAAEGSMHAFINTSTRKLLASLHSDTISKNSFPVPGVPSFDYENESATFNDSDINDQMIPKNAHCRSVIGPILTSQGNRTLNIWVADDCWETDGTKKHLVTTEMITALEDKFLKTGLDNDIYDWVTTILGPEWGKTGYSNLIPPNNEITILLSDINEDNSDTGGVVGYFWAGNNFTASSVSDSNERIMFVIDAVMYANPSLDGSPTATDTTGWTDSAFWPKFVFPTLAHEFQHMIHFYQKSFVANATAPTETWINEMCSMLIEDILADKIGVEGPRGVSSLIGTAGSPGNIEGRLPIFNQYLTNEVIVTSNFGKIADQYADYSVAYAFGAWLARNYGGVEFLHNVVSSPYTDKKAIEYAVQKYTGGAESFERLLQRWGGAIFLSDKTDAPLKYQYNSGGWFTSTINGKKYNLGSINLYNYDPSPEIATSTSQLASGLTASGTNVYLLAKENALG